MLSLRTILPTLPMVAALSANRLAALLLFSPTLRRLREGRERDQAGNAAMASLGQREGRARLWGRAGAFSCRVAVTRPAGMIVAPSSTSDRAVKMAAKLGSSCSRER
jgi:hypothetical protein